MIIWYVEIRKPAAGNVGRNMKVYQACPRYGIASMIALLLLSFSITLY